jgi:hypothetical protein
VQRVAHGIYAIRISAACAVNQASRPRQWVSEPGKLAALGNL